MDPYKPERDFHLQQEATEGADAQFVFAPGARPYVEGTSAPDDFERERLTLNRIFFAVAVETSEDAIIGKTMHAGRITHWNRGAERLYGWSASEIVGQHSSVLVPEDKRTEWNVIRERLATLMCESIVMETVRLHKDGSRIDVSVRLAVVRDPHTGEALGLCSIARDTSERTASEAKLKQSQVRDRRIAQALQRTMLFQPQEDAFPGLTVQTAYATASDEALVGGDFWDTFAFSQRHVAFVLGDVMGHGLSSAVFTTELKHTMRAYIREHEQPADILYHMNKYLCQSARLFERHQHRGQRCARLRSDCHCRARCRLRNTGDCGHGAAFIGAG